MAHANRISRPEKMVVEAPRMNQSCSDSVPPSIPRTMTNISTVNPTTAHESQNLDQTDTARIYRPFIICRPPGPGGDRQRSGRLLHVTIRSYLCRSVAG